MYPLARLLIAALVRVASVASADDSATRSIPLPTATMVRAKAGDQQVLVELPKPREGGSRGEDYRTEHFGAMIGKPAPAVQAATWINAPALPAEQWRGKVVLLDFWAVTCGPCIGALSEEQKFWEANQARDLAMVGLHNTGPALEVQEFLQKLGLKITFRSRWTASTGRRRRLTA